MPKHTGESFTPEIDTADPATFNPKAWVRGTTTVTRSCIVYGRPDLMGEIEALEAQLEEIQASKFDDDRPLARSAAVEVAEQIEELRAQMYASGLRFRLRGLRNGELEKIKAECTEEFVAGSVGELDYRILAAQCVEPQGFDWEDFRDMHTNFGNYFAQTLLVTGNAAVIGGGVDVPFSSASSALTASSSKS
jgi:hypothetical protein